MARCFTVGKRSRPLCRRKRYPPPKFICYERIGDITPGFSGKQVSNQTPYLRIRRVPEAIPQDMTQSELVAAIASGELGPETLVWNEVTTRGEWWTLDNLWIFHRNSPVNHPPGEHLAAELVQDQRCQEQTRRIREGMVAYSKGDLIEEAYGLLGLAEIVTQPGVEGAARFFLLPSFSPERICTVVFGPHGIRLEIVEGATSLWQSLPQLVTQKTPEGLWVEAVGQPFNRDWIRRESWTLDRRQVRWPFESWQRFRAAATDAVDCRRAALDGVSYRHQMRDATCSLEAKWDNADPRHDVAQSRLIRAYEECMQLAFASGPSKPWWHFWH